MNCKKLTVGMVLTVIVLASCAVPVSDNSGANSSSSTSSIIARKSLSSSSAEQKTSVSIDVVHVGSFYWDYRKDLEDEADILFDIPAASFWNQREDLVVRAMITVPGSQEVEVDYQVYRSEFCDPDERQCIQGKNLDPASIDRVERNLNGRKGQNFVYTGKKLIFSQKRKFYVVTTKPSYFLIPQELVSCSQVILVVTAKADGKTDQKQILIDNACGE